MPVLFAWLITLVCNGIQRLSSARMACPRWMGVSSWDVPWFCLWHAQGIFYAFIDVNQFEFKHCSLLLIILVQLQLYRETLWQLCLVILGVNLSLQFRTEKAEYKWEKTTPPKHHKMALVFMTHSWDFLPRLRPPSKIMDLENLLLVAPMDTEPRPRPELESLR